MFHAGPRFRMTEGKRTTNKKGDVFLVVVMRSNAVPSVVRYVEEGGGGSFFSIAVCAKREVRFTNKREGRCTRSPSTHSGGSVVSDPN